MSGLTLEQGKLYKQLEGAIEGKEQIDQILQSASENNLRAVLTAADTKYNALEYGQSYTLTLLGYAICRNNQEGIKAILAAAKGILKEVLTIANIAITSNGSKYILTPLGYAIHKNDQKGIEAVLGTTNDKGILKEVLTTANITITSNGNEYTLTPLGYAIHENDQKGIEAVLAAAKGILEEVLNTPNITVNRTGKRSLTLTSIGFATCVHDVKKLKTFLKAAESLGMLKEVFAVIKKDDRKKIKDRLWEDKDCDMLNKINQVEKIIESEAVRESSSVLVSEPTGEDAKPSVTSENGDNSTVNQDSTTNKAIKTGIAFGVVTGLAVGIVCGVAGIQLSILAIVGIAVAAAVLVGLAAGGIKYAVSKPNSVTNNPDVDNFVANQIGS